MQKQKSSPFRITSILLLICGVTAAILTGKELIWISHHQYLTGGETLFGIILRLLSTVVMAIAGVLGTANSNKPEKAGICLNVGIIALAAYFLSVILLSSFLGIFTDISVVLTTLYILGAKQQKALPPSSANSFEYDLSNPYLDQTHNNQSVADQNSNNDEAAKKIVADYEAPFPSKEAYFETINSLPMDRDGVLYDADGNVTADLRN